MPFGLCNAPATFQRTMDLLLQDFQEFCGAYIDDIVIFSSSLTAHLVQLRKVLDRLRQHKLYVKPSKVELAQPEIDFCGFIVGSGGIRPQPEKLQVI